MDAKPTNSSTRPLSITAASSNNISRIPSQPLPNQPRQPIDLQGLLRYSIEAGTSSRNTEDRPQILPMDENKKTFLCDALSSVVNVMDELQDAVRLLSNVINLPDDDDPCEYENALGRISHYVDNIYVADSFYKIGGFTVFKPCLNSSHSSIRWRTADVIAELAQNNPFCQQRMLETESLLSTLLSMIDTDSSDQAKIKALYAVSCIVRGNPTSLTHMDKYDGYSVLLRAMQSPLEKLQIKSAFLLSNLCNTEESSDVKRTLLKMGFIEQAVGLLSRYDLQLEVREQLLRMLCAMTSDNFLPALEECRESRHCLKAVLEQVLSKLEESEENKDEIDICTELLEKIFPITDTNNFTPC